ncbi:DUF2806 domain-containing protein [Flavobacteriaceae bacterium F89]|uniref:DUF2806 domain-containing protein n=1 Tax=Cerina litoralis TaxID=2874477 RepID=A0AAE3JV31_9FLAO|nr:DUF2806 domain-containing protein [Cerina litoralis]MCG2462962.1 DUF2806 domain-containing protein [Cerina litoralis]
MPEINLIKLDGKPLEKLIEVISNGIGTLYRPRSIRKDADAKAYEIGILENAKAKALSEGKELEAETYIRIQERLIFKETERQNNIDSIAEKTANQLENEPIISEKPVDKDWTKRFFNIAQDVSNEEMQNLWSRILTGEVVNPGSFSLRTLELLKNLSKKEAETFNRMANLAISSFNSPCIYQGKNQKGDFLNKYGSGFNDRLLLIEVGLLQPDSLITRSLPANETDSETFVYHTSGNIILKQILQPKSSKQKISIYRFSNIGEELLRIITIEPNVEYLKEFALAHTNQHSKFELAYILKKYKNGDVDHTNWEEITNANTV